MKKIYRISLLLIILIFISTYNPIELNKILKKDKYFFKVEKIEIFNNDLIKKDEIKKSLKKIYNKNIFLVKSIDIEEPLKQISFFEKVEVKKKYPNTIIVKVFETKPVGILFKNKSKYILDSSSNLISITENTKLGTMPSIFGEGAENNFIPFFNILKNNKFNITRIKNYYYFQAGRWDIELFNNKIIKFPENSTEEVVKKTIELLKRKDFENYNIIDLRVNGKIIVE